MFVNESEKALRYIALLESARLNGLWSEIHELARKVDKHAPHRKCLTLTATSEATIAAATTQPPSTASSTSSYTGLLDVTPKLVQLIDQEKTYFEDAFQANVCLHEIYFMRGEWKTIVGDLNQDVWQQVAQHTKNPLDISPNTRVAILKNRYFLGLAQEQLGHSSAAAQSYRDAIKALQNVPAPVAAASEYRAWAERIVARATSLHSGDNKPSTVSQANAALSSFRQWAGFWDQTPGKGASASTALRGQFDLSRRQVWGRYYDLLSSILSSDLIYSTSSDTPLASQSDVSSREDLAKARLRQRTELKRVETIYETLILQETKFPKASQSNEEVERWVLQAVENWQILCGPRWRDLDLGEGGKAGVSRSMLDILYRAATKTFHSTPILRNLFSVHAALAEFDLAMHAFDTYSEIITRGKSGAEKSGEQEIGLDADDFVMLTASQAIAMLCKYGSRAEAEKAMDISKTLSVWLQQQSTSSSANEILYQKGEPSELERTPTKSLLSQPALAAAYRAIGQSQAHWARLTYETSQRKDLQTKALVSLRKAADLASPAGSDPDTSLLLATVLAETHDLIAAIHVLKRGLALASQAQESDTESISGDPDAPSREQKLAPLWHLLSLLLTARGEYENAVKVCEAAFEQLDGPELFDTSSPTDKSRPASASTQKAIDQLEDTVKESLIQIRLTQLALMEVMESPAAAVDASSSLLALFHKLFGTPAVNNPSSTLAPPQPLAPPPSVPKAGGALKSISGSILGRSKSGRKSMEKPLNEKPADSSLTGSDPLPATIQATNGDGHAEKHHHHFPHHLPHAPFKLRGHVGDWREAGNLKRTGNDGTNEPEQPLRQIPHNLDHEKHSPLSHETQPLEQDVRLPVPHPIYSTSFAPRFPTAQQQRHNISLLIDIWLFIAGQYMRSELLEDADGAIDEAHKLVDGFQQELAKEESSARAFDERGWGGGKSVSRLWADVYTERAALAATRNQPHDALAAYEQALSSFPDHPAAVVGISNILLDMYEEKMSPEPVTLSMPAPSVKKTSTTSSSPPPPAQLNRLAARDRAYMLLNTLSQLGEGWDDSETWMALARAHELSGQVDRAKECLWWVVELEDGRPVRPWGVVSNSSV